MHVSLGGVANGSDYMCFRKNSCDWLRISILQLKYFQLAQTIRISVEVATIGKTMRESLQTIAIGSDYACFTSESCKLLRLRHVRKKNYNLCKISSFQLKQQQLAPTICILVEIVVISSDYACNSCNWCKLCAFHLKSVKLAQIMRV